MLIWNPQLRSDKDINEMGSINGFHDMNCVMAHQWHDMTWLDISSANENDGNNVISVIHGRCYPDSSKSLLRSKFCSVPWYIIWSPEMLSCTFNKASNEAESSTLQSHNQGLWPTDFLSANNAITLKWMSVLADFRVLSLWSDHYHYKLNV